MSDWAEIKKKYVGKVYQKKATKQRYIVADTTFGGSLVMIPYRLRNSILKFNSYRQATLPIAVVESTMKELKP